ncbi:hypothetical protein Tco_1232021, partial [Tanacetum coccineum]
MYDQGLHKEVTDMKEVFTQMETKVVKCSVKRKTFEIKEKELLLENECLLELLISQDLVHTAMNSLAEIIDYQTQLEAKNNSISNLKDHIATLKGKGVAEGDKSANISKEHADTLHEIVEHARALRPLDSDLDFA